MITETDNHAPSLAALVHKTLATGWGAVQNRGELLVVELQEEKGRLVQLFMLCLGSFFLGTLSVLLLTATVIFLFREEYRLYVAAGFAVLYLLGTIVAVWLLKAALKRVPFAESVNQIRKDRELLEAFK